MTNNSTPLLPGSTIGILGGGQLGRLLALAAAKLGMKTHIYCPDPDSPAFDVTSRKTVAAYHDEAALTKFAASVNIVTYEFENVPAQAASLISKNVSLAPHARALTISQDRLLEKQFLVENKVAICAFSPVSSISDLEAALDKIGLPAVLKTTRFGYDGKGQRMINTRDEALGAYTLFAGQPLVLEAFVPFEREISVIVARNGRGEIAIFDPAENVHVNHILHTSTVPANISRETAQQALKIAAHIADALDYRGVLGVEFFVVADGDRQALLVNEIAPRVHNSGHWTESVCATDQFEQHIRAICNWPLGSTQRFADVVMQNLVGESVNSIPAELSPMEQPNIYGKTETRSGRKMGHVNRISIQQKPSE